MKNTIIAVLLVALFSIGLAAQDDCKFEVADDDSFKTAMDAFHKVMAALWHGPVEEGNIEPVKEKVDELKSLRDAVMKANLPEEFAHNCPAITKAAEKFAKSVCAVAEAVDGDAEGLEKAFSKMHDYYRDLRMMTVPVSTYMEKFHDVMHPLWHEAYEAKDAEAIRDGVDDLVKWADLILKSNTGKPGEIEATSQTLVEKVAALKATCEKGTDEEVLEALKVMHDAYHAF